MATVLIVDDAISARAWMAQALTRRGHEVLMAEDGFEAERHFAEAPLDLTVIDIFMPERDGLETLRALKRHAPELPILMISGLGRSGPMDYLAAAKRLGADGTLAKPFRAAELVAAVEGLLREAAPLHSQPGRHAGHPRPPPSRPRMTI